MQSTEFTKPVTTESLLSAFESRFGQTLNLEGLDPTQLEDMANMVRTKIHTITDNAHFGKELTDDNYQKHQSMLDILNHAVKESKLGEYGSNMSNPILDKASEPIKAKLAKGQPLTPDERGAASKLMASKTNENPLMALGAVAARAAGAAAGATAVNRIADKLGASKINKNNMIKNEGIEQQSELILAAKDMMDKVTGYLQDIAEMKTESMLELSDRIRDEMGAEKADAYVAKIQPALESAETTLTQTREELDQGVRILTGEEIESDTVGADDAMNTDAEVGLDDLDTDLGVDDEFGAADASAGGTEPEGRAQRESREVFESSSRIYAKLAGK